MLLGPLEARIVQGRGAALSAHIRQTGGEILLRPYRNRVLIVCLVLVLAFTAVFFRLDSLMIDGQEASTARASSRSTKTLSVTGMRGTIYDVNMTPLAYDRRSYNVTFYRDPSRSSAEDRKGYTRSILKTIQLVESNGKSTITEFWLKKDENGVWRFATNSTSESVNATRESQWRANFYLTNTPEEQLFDALLEKYLIVDVLREEIAEEQGAQAAAQLTDKDIVEQYEDMIVKILAIWQTSRMNNYNSRPVAIAYDVGFETVSEIEARSMELDGMSAEESSTRVYPQGRTAAHAVGYVGRINSQSDMEEYTAKGYPTDAIVGVSGIEKSMEDQLSPYVSYRQGERVVEIDTRGKIVREISYTAPVDGNSVVLTIDSDLQDVMREALQDAINDINYQQRQVMAGSSWQRRNASELARYEDMGHEVQLAESGAMIAMDPNSGRVLGYVSLPDYDLSIFEGGSVDSGAWAQITCRRQQPALRPRHQRQGRPRLHLQALHGAGGPGLRQPRERRAHQRRRPLLTRRTRPTPPSAGRRTSRTTRTRPWWRAFPTPATTSSTKSASAPARRRSTNGRRRWASPRVPTSSCPANPPASSATRTPSTTRTWPSRTR